MSKYFFIIEPLHSSTTSSSAAAVTVSPPSVDLRSIFDIIANVVDGIAFTLNIFLLGIILKNTPAKIADYKIILLQNCFVDLIFVIGNFVVKGQPEYKTDTFFLIGSHFLDGIPYPFDILLFLYYGFALFYCLTSTPVQFVYRYFTICQGKTLSTCQYLALLLISTIGAAIFAGMFGYVIWPNTKYYEAMANLLKSDNFFFKGIPKFVVAPSQHWSLITCFTFGYFLVLISYIIIVITCVKIWKKLKSQSISFSEKTRRLHKQMTKIMIVQATVPFFLLILPVGLGITSSMGILNIPRMGMFLHSIGGWAPVANPFVAIVSIKAYREVIISWICKCLRIKFQQNTVTVTSVSVFKK